MDDKLKIYYSIVDESHIFFIGETEYSHQLIQDKFNLMVVQLKESQEKLRVATTALLHYEQGERIRTSVAAIALEEINQK